MTAVTILKELNRIGRRKVPDNAPDAFMPTRLRDYLLQARQSPSAIGPADRSRPARRRTS